MGKTLAQAIPNDLTEGFRFDRNRGTFASMCPIISLSSKYKVDKSIEDHLKSREELLSEVLKLRLQLDVRTEAAAGYEKAEMFRLIFENAPIGIAYVTADFKTLKVNRALYELLGYSEEELLKMTFIDITHPDDIEKDVELAGQLYRLEIPNYQLEKRYITKDQRIIWVNLNATIFQDRDGTLFGIGLVEDITVRKQAEEALKLSEAKYRMVMNQAADGIMLFDSAGIIIGANSKACEMLGYQPDELLHMDVKALLASEDRETLTDRLERLHKGEIISGERTVIRKDGSQFLIEISAKQLPDRTLHAAFRDVTKRKETEAERVQLIEQLQQALAEVKTLSELLPICSSCKKVRDDRGYWQQIESYITEHTGTLFSHCICRECAKSLYPSYYQKMYGESSEDQS
jgi:PAS domain S-box-containing protein